MDGIYIGAMGIITNQVQLNTHANNIANANTNGYKFDTMLGEVFEHKRAYRNEAGIKSFIGNYENKVVNEGMFIHLTPGQFIPTNQPFDVAIDDGEGEGTSFFVIEENGQEYLTRNGAFRLNEERYLSTYSGSYVLDINGNEIQIPENTEFYLDEDGMIRNKESDEAIAQLQIRVVQEVQREFLQKENEVRFVYDEENGGPLMVSNAKILPNTIETSNVDMTEEMVRLLQSQRRVQASQKVMLTFDEVYKKEANDFLG